VERVRYMTGDGANKRKKKGGPRCQSLLIQHTCPGRPPAVTFGDAFGTLVAGD
jgi:hypothetical protein